MTFTDRAASVVKAGFGAASRLRSARIFHPDGAVFTGTIRLSDAASPGAAALGAPGSWPVTVRASKALGTPGEWPDIHGIAVRISHDVGLVDLLFATVGSHLPFVLAPSGGWGTQPYSTLLPYQTDKHHVVLRLDAAEPDRAPAGDLDSIRSAVATAPLLFVLSERAGLGSWRPIGQLALESGTEAQVAFDPVVNQHPRLTYPDAVARFRSWAYSGSRQGRDADTEDVVTTAGRDSGGA
jgi:hypothetical protein